MADKFTGASGRFVTITPSDTATLDGVSRAVRVGTTTGDLAVVCANSRQTVIIPNVMSGEIL